VDPTAPAFLLAGDESALPAIGQLITCLRALDPGVPVQVHVEVATPAGRLALPAHSLATVTWWYLPDGAAPGSALLDAVRGCSLVAGIRVWVAGEAAAVQRIRRHLFDDRGLARAQATVRGYWKHGRSGDPSDEPS
jgi:NADPH-dependent ferric siderophore reductase